MVMGREKLSPEERLREKAAAFKLLAEGLPYGREREDLLVRARRNAFTMAGSHGSAEAATTSVASIKSASQTVLGSALGKVERSMIIPISASDTRRKHEPRRC